LRYFSESAGSAAAEERQQTRAAPRNQGASVGSHVDHFKLTSFQISKSDKTMPSVMEEPSVIFLGPRPIEDCTLVPYDVRLPSGSTARLFPIKHPKFVPASLIAYLASEMNDEVFLQRKIS